MKQNKNKKKWTAAAASLAIIAALAGTFAWFTSNDNTKNHFETGMAGNDVEIVETFDPPKDWKPGQNVKKEVAVTNTGEYKSLIRVTFDESIKKVNAFNPKTINVVGATNEIAAVDADKDIYVYPFTGSTSGMTASTLDTKYTATILGKSYTLKTFEKATPAAAGGNHYSYVSYWENDSDSNDKLFAKTGTMTRATDGKVTPALTDAKYVDLTKGSPNEKDWAQVKPSVVVDDTTKTAVVTSAADSNITIKLVNITSKPTEGFWYYNDADGYFYYVGVVEPQGQTPILVDSVKLSENAGNEYSKMEYDLNVKAEGIQAIKEAVNSAQWVNGTNSTLQTKLENLPNLDVSER